MRIIGHLRQGSKPQQGERLVALCGKRVRVQKAHRVPRLYCGACVREMLRRAR